MSGTNKRLVREKVEPHRFTEAWMREWVWDIKAAVEDDGIELLEMFERMVRDDERGRRH